MCDLFKSTKNIINLYITKTKTLIKYLYIYLVKETGDMSNLYKDINISS